MRDRRQAERGSAACRRARACRRCRCASPATCRCADSCGRLMPTRAPSRGAPPRRRRCAQPAAESAAARLHGGVVGLFMRLLAQARRAASRSTRSVRSPASGVVGARLEPEALQQVLRHLQPVGGAGAHVGQRLEVAAPARPARRRRSPASRAGRRARPRPARRACTIAAMPPKARRTSATTLAVELDREARRTAPRCRSRSACRSCRRAPGARAPPAAPSIACTNSPGSSRFFM